MMVPGTPSLPRPKSSTPSTRTTFLTPSAQKAPLMRLRRMSGLTSNPNSRANLAPASPPRAKAIHSRASLWRSVARAKGRVTDRQALGEDLALAGGLVAEELAHSNPEAHRRAAPRQVGQSAHVATVDPQRELPAQRALGREIGRGGVDRQQVCGEREFIDVQLFGDGEAAAVRIRVGHEFPPHRAWRDFMKEPSPSPKDRKSRRLDKQCLLIEVRM